MPENAAHAFHRQRRHRSNPRYEAAPRGRFFQGNLSQHRIRQDEGWHFYLGDPLLLVEISPTGVYSETIMGPDILAGHKQQHIVPAGSWFGARPVSDGAFSFVGCTVAPGFDFADFELAERDALTKLFPHLAQPIAAFT